MNLLNRTAVVTGANGAIGSALTKELESQGARVIAIDKDSANGCDFTNLDEVEKMARYLATEYEKIDFLYNIAGIGVYKTISELSVEEWQNTFFVNAASPFILSKYLIASLKKSDNAMIFNIGSGMGVLGASSRASYCASKFALRGLSLSLSKELKTHAIDVCLLTLGSVMTPFGTGGIDKRKELERAGKNYLSVREVIDKILAITKSSNREEEYVMYPEGYI